MNTERNTAIRRTKAMIKHHKKMERVFRQYGQIENAEGARRGRLASLMHLKELRKM